MKRIVTILAFALLVGLAFTGWRIFDASAQPGKGITHRSPLQFESSKSSPDDISRNVAAVGNLIYDRSGLRMSRSTRNRLASLEERYSKAGMKLPVSTVKDMLVQVFSERIAKMDQSEVNKAKALMGDTRNKRFSDGINQAKAVLKDSSFSTIVGSRISDAVDFTLQQWKQQFPDQFASSDSVTPTQAFLIAYATASNDSLLGSAAQIRHEEQFATTGVEDIQKKFPYAINDDLNSTPTALLFGSKTVDSLLAKVEAQGGHAQ